MRKQMSWNETLSVDVQHMLGEFETGYEREMRYTKVEQFDCAPTLAEIEELTEYINVY
jgi:hypothetical protein